MDLWEKMTQEERLWIPWEQLKYEVVGSCPYTCLLSESC